MKLEEVLPAFREGKKIRIVNNRNTTYHLGADNNVVVRIRIGNLIEEHSTPIIPFASAFDWEVVE